MTSNMAMEKKYGQITLNMRVNILKVKSMAKAHMSGQMDQCMKEIGLKIELKAMEFIHG